MTVNAGCWTYRVGPTNYNSTMLVRRSVHILIDFPSGDGGGHLGVSVIAWAGFRLEVVMKLDASNIMGPNPVSMISFFLPEGWG